MRLTSEGILLVGTDTAIGSAKLQVSGAISVSGITYAGTLALSATGANPITFSSGGTEGFRLAPTTRNLLVGTTTDDGSSKLQVAGTIKQTNNTGFISARTDSGSAYVGILNSANQVAIGYNSDAVVLMGGTQQMVTLTSTGTLTHYNPTTTTGVTSFVVKAGAGQSTNPLQSWVNNAGTGMSHIDQNGTFVYSGDGNVIYSGSGSSPSSWLNFSGATYISTDTNTPLILRANATERIRINNTGIGFFGVTPVARAAALTAANNGTLNTGDATSDTIIGNMRTRIAELEAKLQAYGLLN